MKKIVITGGCGFIGSHLVEMLCDDNKVIVIDNLSTGRLENIEAFLPKGVRFINADISLSHQIWESELEQADWVFHLAALADIVPSIESPDAYFSSNVVGTFNVLQAALRGKLSRFIYAASSSCYGIPSIYPTPEDSPILPQYPYALTKRLGEELVLHWANLYKLPAISARFFNVYGTRSRTSGTYGAVFGVFLAQKLAGKPFTVVGDGEQTRDFTYVTDVCNALCTLAKQGQVGEVYNIGSGQTISVNRIVELLKGPVINIPKRPGEPDCTYADITKITSQTNWQPAITIEEGIKKILLEIRYWNNAPVWEPEQISVATSKWFQYLK
ncbi:SDR family oxidoreductase [Polynucleobacter paneuropaeus]|nr:SDR family oxidoreductase [Polynucleobacter paneuropaeus]